MHSSKEKTRSHEPPPLQALETLWKTICFPHFPPWSVPWNAFFLQNIPEMQNRREYLFSKRISGNMWKGQHLPYTHLPSSPMNESPQPPRTRFRSRSTRSDAATTTFTPHKPSLDAIFNPLPPSPTEIQPHSISPIPTFHLCDQWD